MNETQRFTEGKIFSTLIRFAAPVSSAVQILLCVGFFLVTQRGRRKCIHK